MPSSQRKKKPTTDGNSRIINPNGFGSIGERLAGPPSLDSLVLHPRHSRRAREARIVPASQHPLPNGTPVSRPSSPVSHNLMETINAKRGQQYRGTVGGRSYVDGEQSTPGPPKIPANSTPSNALVLANPRKKSGRKIPDEAIKRIVQPMGRTSSRPTTPPNDPLLSPITRASRAYGGTEGNIQWSERTETAIPRPPTPTNEENKPGQSSSSTTPVVPYTDPLVRKLQDGRQSREYTGAYHDIKYLKPITSEAPAVVKPQSKRTADVPTSTKQTAPVSTKAMPATPTAVAEAPPPSAKRQTAIDGILSREEAIAQLQRNEEKEKKRQEKLEFKKAEKVRIAKEAAGLRGRQSEQLDKTSKALKKQRQGATDSVARDQERIQQEGDEAIKRFEAEQKNQPRLNSAALAARAKAAEEERLLLEKVRHKQLPLAEYEQQRAGAKIDTEAAETADTLPVKRHKFRATRLKNTKAKIAEHAAALDDYQRQLREADKNGADDIPGAGTVTPPLQAKTLDMRMRATWFGAWDQNQMAQTEQHNSQLDAAMAKEFGDGWKGLEAWKERERKRSERMGLEESIRAVRNKHNLL